MEKNSKKQKVYVDNIIDKIYYKIANWHNNDDGLSPSEKQRELKFLCVDIIEDVVTDFTKNKGVQVMSEKPKD